MKSNKYWFRPKAYGYGAEPCSWEGWILILGFIIYMIVVSAYFLPDNMNNYYLFVFIGILLLIIISKSKTEGDWKWNWGRKSQ